MNWDELNKALKGMKFNLPNIDPIRSPETFDPGEEFFKKKKRNDNKKLVTTNPITL